MYKHIPFVSLHKRMYTYIYVYIYIERERCLYVYMYIHIYRYIYIYISVYENGRLFKKPPLPGPPLSRANDTTAASAEAALVQYNAT